MAPTLYKEYNDEDFDIKLCAETHFSQSNAVIIEESMGFPIRIMHDLISQGQLKGEKLLDISYASFVYQLFSASNVYKEIHVVQLTDNGFTQFKQWLEKSDAAIDWSYPAKRVCHLEGNSQCWREKEDQLRRAIKGVYKWNLECPITDLQLVPPVDCVIILWILIPISKTKEELQSNLRRLTSKLKIGGQLVLFIGLNMSYYTVGEHRFFCLSVDEATIQESVIKAGLIIEKTFKTAAVESNGSMDYSHLLCILARKEREV